MSELLRHVALKLSRAESQAQTLNASISDWSAKNPITADCRLRDDRLGYELVQNAFHEAPPLDYWGLSFGECIHNLRSALDNLAYALARVKRDPPLKPGKISFPIHTDKALFHSKERPNIEQWPLDAVRVLESLQPFQRDGRPGNGNPADDSLLLLHSLSITDKHRVPPITLIAPTELTHDVAVMFRTSEEASLNVPPDMEIWGDALVPGVTLIRLRTVSPIESVSGKYEGKAVVSIVRDGTPMPVGPLLIGLHGYTALVVSQFGAFFK